MKRINKISVGGEDYQIYDKAAHEKIDGLEIPEVDLSEYATKTELEDYVSKEENSINSKVYYLTINKDIQKLSDEIYNEIYDCFINKNYTSIIVTNTNFYSFKFCFDFILYDSYTYQMRFSNSNYDRYNENFSAFNFYIDVDKYARFHQISNYAYTKTEIDSKISEYRKVKIFTIDDNNDLKSGELADDFVLNTEASERFSTYLNNTLLNSEYDYCIKFIYNKINIYNNPSFLKLQLTSSTNGVDKLYYTETYINDSSSTLYYYYIFYTNNVWKFNKYKKIIYSANYINNVATQIAETKINELNIPDTSNFATSEQLTDLTSRVDDIEDNAIDTAILDTLQTNVNNNTQTIQNLTTSFTSYKNGFDENIQDLQNLVQQLTNRIATLEGYHSGGGETPNPPVSDEQGIILIYNADEDSHYFILNARDNSGLLKSVKATSGDAAQFDITDVNDKYYIYTDNINGASISHEFEKDNYFSLFKYINNEIKYYNSFETEDELWDAFDSTEFANFGVNTEPVNPPTGDYIDLYKIITDATQMPTSSTSGIQIREDDEGNFIVYTEDMYSINSNTIKVNSMNDYSGIGSTKVVKLTDNDFLFNLNAYASEEIDLTEAGRCTSNMPGSVFKLPAEEELSTSYLSRSDMIVYCYKSTWQKAIDAGYRTDCWVGDSNTGNSDCKWRLYDYDENDDYNGKNIINKSADEWSGSKTLTVNIYDQEGTPITDSNVKIYTYIHDLNNEYYSEDNEFYGSSSWTKSLTIPAQTTDIYVEFIKWTTPYPINTEDYPLEVDDFVITANSPDEITVDVIISGWTYQSYTQKQFYITPNFVDSEGNTINPDDIVLFNRVEVGVGVTEASNDPQFNTYSKNIQINTYYDTVEYYISLADKFTDEIVCEYTGTISESITLDIVLPEEYTNIPQDTDAEVEEYTPVDIFTDFESAIKFKSDNPTGNLRRYTLVLDEPRDVYIASTNNNQYNKGFITTKANSIAINSAYNDFEYGQIHNGSGYSYRATCGNQNGNPYDTVINDITISCLGSCVGDTWMKYTLAAGTYYIWNSKLDNFQSSDESLAIVVCDTGSSCTTTADANKRVIFFDHKLSEITSSPTNFGSSQGENPQNFSGSTKWITGDGVSIDMYEIKNINDTYLFIACNGEIYGPFDIQDKTVYYLNADGTATTKPASEYEALANYI